jgi:hypothetical protein
VLVRFLLKLFIFLMLKMKKKILYKKINLKNFLCTFLRNRNQKMSQSWNREYFTSVQKIKYDPNASIDNALVFRHYNPDEVAMGKTMREWLRFAVCCWHTFTWYNIEYSFF